ncbi:MAG: polysaccharide deacetylase family protein [Armatimonadia bacterium]
MPDTLYVMWTMDCEAVQHESMATGGVADWGLSERAMRGYVEALSARGQQVTLFVTPRLAEKQAPVVLDLIAAGAEPGLHLHPQTIDLGYTRHLGQLPPPIQRNLLRVSLDRVERAIGRRPTSFRPGCLSATRETLDLLVELGFTQGNLTLPGRNLPDLAALWANADPFANRPVPGFLELPITVHLDDLNSQGHAGDPRHLRLERDDIAAWAPDLIRRYLQRQMELALPLKTLHVMTHNTRDYAAPADPARQSLEAVADLITAAAAEVGLQVQPIAMRDLEDRFPA